ncbi:MAG TPA: hypothetical protein VK539_39650 [Myxococcaceae bacterium]|nr:hypothetical protein [Myxococcaceae bacterium]
MELTDEMQKRDERSAKFKKAVRERIFMLEEEIPNALEELHKLRDEMASLESWGPGWAKAGMTAPEWRQKVDAQGTRIESLFRELAALEGGIERRDVRSWRWVTLGLSLVALVSTMLQWLTR